MGGPWEDYAVAADDGPWNDYAKPKRKGGAAGLAKSAVTGLAKGVQGVAELGESLTPTGLARNTLNRFGANIPSPLGAGRSAISTYGHKPETRGERYTEAVAEQVPNALAPGGLLRRAASVVLPGIAGEGAREAAEAAGMGKTGQSVAKFAGGFAGGLGASAQPLRRLATAGQDNALNAFARRAKVDPVEMRAKANALSEAGVQPSLIDVAGDRGRRFVRAVGVKSEMAGERLASNARAVSSSAKPAIMARTRDVGPMRGKTADDLSQEIDAARSASAQKNYAEPYATPVTVPDKVMDMLADSSGRSIISRARADAIERQDWMQQAELDMLLRLPDKGGVGPLPRVSAGTIDRLVIAARERGNKFMERGNRMRAGGSYQRQKQLDSVLNDVEEIKPARQDYRNKSQAIGVLGKERQDIFSTDPGDYGRWLQGLSPEARQANQVAIRQEVLDTLGGQRSSTFGSVDELATSEYAKANLAQALGADAKPYLAFLEAKLEQVRNARMVDPNAGSRTAVLENDLGGVMRDVGAVGGKAMSGNPVGAAFEGAKIWLARRGISEQQARVIAEASTDPAKLQNVLAYLEQKLGKPAAQQYLEQLRRPALAGVASGAIAASGSQ